MRSPVLTALANGLWWLSTLPEAARFHRAARDPAAAQEALLLQILRRNRVGRFGQEHGFGAIRSVAEFQRRVPLSSYEDYREAVDQIAAGEPGVLTAEPVRLLEPTSGSSAASKLIPYTAGLQADFRRAIDPWIADLFRRRPELLGAQAYWSISPVVRKERSPGGLPIGFEDDAAYLGGLQRRLTGAVMAVPPEVRWVEDVTCWRYLTLLFLLRSDRLGLISVWSPTFLTLLVEPLHRWWRQLAYDIERGDIAMKPEDPELARALARANRPDPARARQVLQAFQRGGGPGAVHARLWPRLRVISCWTDDAASPYIPQMRRLFPQAEIHPKGLIATEGIVTIPQGPDGARVPAIRSHFFEFLPPEGGDPLLVHQLEEGRTYEVVLTTSGGLYRYRMGDLVRVTGFWQGLPALTFTGRGDAVADHVGEKLHEAHVRQALERVLARRGVTAAFAMVACERYPEGLAYTLFVEPQADVPDEALCGAAADLERELQANFHYAYARRLGQLGPVRPFRVTGDGLRRYVERCALLGQRLGDIKPVALHRAMGWRDALEGREVGAVSAHLSIR